MDYLLQTNTGLLPPTLRALALGVLVETVVPLLNNPRGDGTVPSDSVRGETPPNPRQGEGDDAKARLWEAVRSKCSELSALVLWADDPGEAAAYALAYLPKHFDYVFELVQGQRRRRSLGIPRNRPNAEVRSQNAERKREDGAVVSSILHSDF